MIAMLCAGFAAVCFFALGWLFSSWFNEKREKTELTTFNIPFAKSQLTCADRVAIRYLMPYLKSALLELAEKKNNSLGEMQEKIVAANSFDRLEKLCKLPTCD